MHASLVNNWFINSTVGLFRFIGVVVIVFKQILPKFTNDRSMAPIATVCNSEKTKMKKHDAIQSAVIMDEPMEEATEKLSITNNFGKCH